VASKILWRGALWLAIAWAIGAPEARSDDSVGFDVSKIYEVPADGQPARGAAEPLVTIVEFSDFHCAYCRMAADTLADVLRLFPDDVRVVYRHSLLDPEDGTLAAEASLAAADQGRFWPMHDRLFAASAGIDRAEVDRAAREIGLDLDRFRNDLDSGRFLSAARAADRGASLLGVSATPVFFVNGRPLVGAHGLGTFVRLIEEERARAAALVKGGTPRREVYRAAVDGGLARARPTLPGADRVAAVSLDGDTVYPVGLGLPSHRTGSDQALVTVVEFGDFLCSYCVKVQAVLRRLRADYGDDIRWVYRHMPVIGGPTSRLIAEATVAAGEQGKFWDMHDALYRHPARIGRPELETLAESLGLDMRAFRAALDARSHQRAVAHDLAAAVALGVRGTPTFFINGQAVVGAQDAETFRAVIDATLREAMVLEQGGVPRSEIYRRVTGRQPTDPPR